MAIFKIYAYMSKLRKNKSKGATTNFFAARKSNSGNKGLMIYSLLFFDFIDLSIVYIIEILTIFFIGF